MQLICCNCSRHTKQGQLAINKKITRQNLHLNILQTTEGSGNICGSTERRHAWIVNKAPHASSSKPLRHKLNNRASMRLTRHSCLRTSQRNETKQDLAPQISGPAKKQGNKNEQMNDSAMQETLQTTISTAENAQSRRAIRRASF